MTTGQLAQRVGCSTEFLIEARRNGFLRAEKVSGPHGGARLVWPDDAEQAARSHFLRENRARRQHPGNPAWENRREMCESAGRPCVHIGGDVQCARCRAGAEAYAGIRSAFEVEDCCGYGDKGE